MPTASKDAALNAVTQAAGRRVRVIIAEDFILVQEAIRLLLEPQCDVVAVADDGEAAIELAAKYKPDILLVDVSLPLATGFRVAEKVRSLDPDIKVIFVTAHADRNYVERAFELGACGYVMKSSVRVELPLAIAEAMRGSMYRSPIVASNGGRL